MSGARAWESLSWDSHFLGFSVGRLPAQELSASELAAQVTAAREAGMALLYLVAAPGDKRSNASARQAGARLADRKVTFGMPVAAEAWELPISRAIRPTVHSTARLESLALQSGEYSRFRLDPRFEASVFPRLYGLWLRNSLSHELAREVLVFEPEAGAEAVGLLTLGVKQGRADIGLLAVDEQSRGQQIGQQLVQAARQRAAAWGLAELQVVTQLDNEPACLFYRKCGFAEYTVEHIYHLWL